MTTRVALITGCGKRDGMGRAIANTLAASGVAVVVTDKAPAGVLNRRQEVLGVVDDGWRGVDSLVGEISSSGGSALSLLGDISVAEDARRMVDEAAAWRGRLDILVNGAAAPQGLDRQDIEDVPIDVWDFVISVNLRGTYLMSRFAVPHMRAQRWGRIINISSQAGQVAAAMSTAYSASKAGVIAFTKAAAKEVARTGVLVNCVVPGVLDAGLTEKAPEEERLLFLSRIPMGRMGSAGELAELVSWLASERCSFSTGAAFDLSGGRAVY